MLLSRHKGIRIYISKYNGENVYNIAIPHVENLIILEIAHINYFIISKLCMY